MKRLLGFLGLVALFAWPMACSRQSPPAAESPQGPAESRVAQRPPRCAYGRVPEADARIITDAIQAQFRPSPDNTYEVLGVYYAEPERGPRYGFLAVLRVVGIAGPSVPLFDQVTGSFDRRTRQATGLARSTFDPARCPEVATTSAAP